jgi:hypothetical protein
VVDEVVHAEHRRLHVAALQHVGAAELDIHATAASTLIAQALGFVLAQRGEEHICPLVHFGAVVSSRRGPNFRERQPAWAMTSSSGRAMAVELVRAGSMNNRGGATGSRAILDKLQAMLGPHGVLPGREHGNAIAGVTEVLLSIGGAGWIENNELALHRSAPCIGEPLHLALAIVADTGARPGARWSVGKSLEEVAKQLLKLLPGEGFRGRNATSSDAVLPVGWAMRRSRGAANQGAFMAHCIADPRATCECQQTRRTT